MRILHLHGQYFAFGGAETYLRNVRSAQAAQGHEVSVLYASEPPIGGGLREWEACVPPSFGVRSGLRTKGRVLREIASRSPELVHLHVAHFALSPLVLRAILRQWPVVYSVHDLLWLCAKGLRSERLTDYARILPNGLPCDRPLGLACAGCLASSARAGGLGFGRALMAAWRLRTLKGVRQFVVNGRYVKGVLERQGIGAERIHVLPPPVDVPRTKAEPPDPPPNRGAVARILFVGRLARIKGVYDLVDAVGLLGEGPWELSMVGDGDEEQDLRAYVEARGLSDRVAFCGGVARDELAGFYRSARLLVLPSRCPETYGLVGPEAMSFGVPVVAFDAGAVREWLEDGATGYLVEPGNVERLAARIRELLRDDRTREAMSARAAGCGPALGGWRDFLNGLEPVYERALRSAPEV